MSSKIDDAVTRALSGDAAGALQDIGQASHTAQDIIRHHFETAGEHGWSEPAATDAETTAATAATDQILERFAVQLFVQGVRQGMSFSDIWKMMDNTLKGGQDTGASDNKPQPAAEPGGDDEEQ
jgi:hypothetical protein